MFLLGARGEEGGGGVVETGGGRSDLLMCLVIHSHQVLYVDCYLSILSELFLPNGYVALHYYIRFLNARVRLPALFMFFSYINK